MIRLVILISLQLSLISSTLDITKFFYKGREYYDIRLSSDKDFKCKKSIDYKLKTKIICNLNLNKKDKREFDLFFLDANQTVIITPKYKYKIVSFESDDEFFKNIILYKEKSDFFLENKNFYGLNFKVKYKIKQKLHIPVLNDDLNPQVIIQDAHRLSFAQKLFKKGEYDSVIKYVDREIDRRNRFESDLYLLKLKALDKILEDKYGDYRYDDIIKVADQFLKKFPSNKDFTHVVYFKIKSLFKIGRKKRAFKLLEKLKNSFQGDLYTEKALIEEAKFLSNDRKSRGKSKDILRDLLYSTNHVDTALISANLLTKYSLLDKNILDARKYLEKILSSHSKFLLENLQNSYKLAKRFALLKDYESAVKIAKVLHEKKNDEEFMKNYALWQDKAGFKDDAYKSYKKYLKEFPQGKFVDFIKERMQKVLLDTNETNSTKKLSDIDQIIKNYSNEPIYKKALIKKVEIFKKEKKFEDILKLEKELKDINRSDFVNFAATELFNQYISKDDCQKSIELIDKYKVTIKDSEKLYKLNKCYFDFAMYKESCELATKYIKSAKESENLDKWYYLAIKSLIKDKKYKKAQTLFDDFKKLVDIDKSKYKDIYYDVFDLYINKKDKKHIFEIVGKIEKLFVNRAKNLDVYYKVIKYLVKNRDSDLLIVYYAKKLLDLQKVLKVTTYSAQVDVILIRSLVRLGKNKEALKYFADAYLDKNKTDSQKSELLYLAGEASLKLGKKKQAKEFFSKCGSETKSKLWLKLCSESLKLLDFE